MRSQAVCSVTCGMVSDVAPSRRRVRAQTAACAVRRLSSASMSAATSMDDASQESTGSQHPNSADEDGVVSATNPRPHWVEQQPLPFRVLCKALAGALRSPEPSYRATTLGYPLHVIVCGLTAYDRTDACDNSLGSSCGLR